MGIRRGSFWGKWWVGRLVGKLWYGIDMVEDHSGMEMELPFVIMLCLFHSSSLRYK